MSNIYDIAEKTGYSASTVARALSGRGYTSEKARTVIQKAARELNYTPNQAAKILKSSHTQKVMLCIPDLYNPYYFAMIEGVNQVLDEQGYYTILVHSNHSKKKELEIVKALEERFVDGLVMTSFDFDARLAKALAAAPVPVILTNLYEGAVNGKGFDCVFVDHTHATYIATAELLQTGHRRIVFVGGSLAEQTGRERLAGYEAALAEAGRPVEDTFVLQGDYSRDSGYRQLLAFLDTGAPFDGIVACNDLMAVGCLNACEERGVALPRDASLISMDNTEFCTCTRPRLTSVNMMQRQIGSNAAELMLERIDKTREYSKAIRLKPGLVRRDSVRERGT